MPKNPFRVHGVANSLWSNALAPVARDARTWNALRCCSSLSAWSVCIPAWLLASGLMAAGMTPMETLAIILLGSLLMLALMILQAHAGTKYGIGYGVAARASFGVLGARVPLALRALVAAGWFGVHCWIGALALFHLAPASLSAPLWRRWPCLGIICLLSIAGALTPAKAARVASWLPPLLLLLLAGGGLLQASTHGAELLTTRASASLSPDGATIPLFWSRFVPSLTAVMGFWALAATGIADHSRHAEAQRSQRRGLLGAVAAMMVISSLAVVITAGTPHAVIWNPLNIVAGLSPGWAEAGFVAVAIAALAGASANLRRAAEDITSLFSRALSIRSGVVLAAAAGLLCAPWKLPAGPESYLHLALPLCAGLLGPVCGIMLADYFLVRRRWLNVDSLYERDGIYEYTGGVNPKSLGSLAGGILVSLIGLFLPPLSILSDAAGFVGFAVAGGLYLLQISGPAPVAPIPPAPLLIPVAEFDR